MLFRSGDLTQKDLPFDIKSGLEQALEVLSKVEDIGFSYMTNRDVVRHPLVQKIVTAYDDYEKRQERKNQVAASKRNQSQRAREGNHQGRRMRGN